MAKVKAKTPARTKGVVKTATPKKKQGESALPAPKAAKRPRMVALDKSQEYYIKGNMEVLAAPTIAQDLGLPVEVVDQYIEGVRNAAIPAVASRTNRLLQRPLPGVVAMTEGASMAADDARKSAVITQAEINQAAASGNRRLAAELAAKRDQQVVDAAAQYQARYGHCIHRPRG